MRRGEWAPSSAGFAYVALLALVAMLGIGLAAVGTVWSADRQREREQELLRVGAAYAEAIASYRRLSPGSVSMAPPTLAALVHDDRFIRIHRHLRALYPDPMNPGQPWGLVTDDAGRVLGVYSQSRAVPLRRAALVTDSLQLPAAASYAEWKFVPREIR